MARKAKPVAPTVVGLVAGRPFVGTWLKRPGTMITYHRPDDCRPMGLRLIVKLWDDGKGSEARVVEGDSLKPPFQVHGRAALPDHPSDDDVRSVVRKLAEAHMALPATGADVEGRTLAGVLTSAGFLHDDFMGTTAWLKPSNREGFMTFVRGTPDPAFFEDEGEQVAVPRAGELESVDLPCEVGILHEDDLGMSTVIVPSVDDALRLLEEDSVPYPTAVGEHEVHAFETLGAGPRP